MFALYSPKGTYDGIFLANYAYININDQMTRVPGIASVTVFGAGQYAMRLWVKPDQLAKLNITIPEIINAVKAQNTVNPAGQIGGEPVPQGQEFTYAVRAQGRLQTEEEFGEIVLRADPDGSIVRVKDVARIELGAQNYNMKGRLNGKPAALIALYQLPGSNAIEAADGAKKLMAELKQRFPAGPGLRRRARHHPGRHRRHEGNHEDAVRGPGPGHPRGVPLPAGLAGDAHSAAGRAGLAGRHLRPVPAVRLLHQHAVALRPGAGHRPGGG